MTDLIGRYTLQPWLRPRPSTEKTRVVGVADRWGVHEVWVQCVRMRVLFKKLRKQTIIEPFDDVMIGSNNCLSLFRYKKGLTASHYLDTRKVNHVFLLLENPFHVEMIHNYIGVLNHID
jgi:methylphosphotriester-DNA--protein-cysteine methyltransferase